MLIIGWISAFFIEKRHVARPSQLPIILPVFYSMEGFDFLEKILTHSFEVAWEEWNFHGWIKVYLCFGVILGFTGLLCYLKRIRCPKLFYKLTFWLYSSKTVMPLATSIALFLHFHPTLLYGTEFLAAFVFLFLLSWFPKSTIVTIIVIFGFLHYTEQ